MSRQGINFTLIIVRLGQPHQVAADEVSSLVIAHAQNTTTMGEREEYLPEGSVLPIDVRLPLRSTTHAGIGDSEPQETPKVQLETASPAIQVPMRTLAWYGEAIAHFCVDVAER